MDEELNIKDILKAIEEMRKNQAKTDEQLAITEGILAETNAIVQENARRSKEIQETQAKTDEQMAQTDAEIKQLRESQTQTDAQLAKTDAQLAKTDAQLAKTDAQLEKTSRKIDHAGEILANIGINTGQSAEEFFYRRVSKTLKLGGMQFDRIERNVQLSDNFPEYDMVLYNGKHVMILEVKYKAHPEQIGVLAIQKTRSFRKLYPNTRTLNCISESPPK